MDYQDPKERELYRVQQTAMGASSYGSPSATPKSNAHTLKFHQPRQTQTHYYYAILKAHSAASGKRKGEG